MSAGNIAHAKNKATTGNKDKTPVKKVHLILCALFTVAIIISVVFICRTGEWVHFAGLGISSFILALVCMDYMTYKAQDRVEQRAEKIEGKIKGLDKNKGQVGDEITGLDKRWKSLPVAEQIALLFPEPVGVLDRHEIRRALVISLTIVYIILLFKGAPMAEHFTWVYLTIIAFYFGSRSLEKFAEVRKKNGQE